MIKTKNGLEDYVKCSLAGILAAGIIGTGSAYASAPKNEGAVNKLEQKAEAVAVSDTRNVSQYDYAFSYTKDAAHDVAVQYNGETVYMNHSCIGKNGIVFPDPTLKDIDECKGNNANGNPTLEEALNYKKIQIKKGTGLLSIQRTLLIPDLIFLVFNIQEEKFYLEMWQK